MYIYANSCDVFVDINICNIFSVQCTIYFVLDTLKFVIAIFTVNMNNYLFYVNTSVLYIASYQI